MFLITEDAACRLRWKVNNRNFEVYLVRPERLELPAYWFEASRSIQLSYGRTINPILPAMPRPQPGC